MTAFKNDAFPEVVLTVTGGKLTKASADQMFELLGQRCPKCPVHFDINMASIGLRTGDPVYRARFGCLHCGRVIVIEAEKT